MGRCYQIVVSVLLLNCTFSKCEFLQSCPSQCKCSWSAGKNSADCSYKSLQQIPDNFRTELQVLTMDGNNLKVLAPQTFKSPKLRSVSELSMTNCRIHLLQEQAFEGLRNLRTINLSNNNITSVPAKFPPLTYLRKLDFSHNILSSVSPKAFLNLGHSVVTLDLRGNLLTSLHGQLLRPLYKVQHVFLMDNLWNCDCHLKAFRDFIIAKRLSPAQVSCYEPERLADKSWAEIESDDFACKPLAKMNQELLRVGPGMNISLECGVMGSPSPAVRWVRGGRILANMSSSPLANVANMKYLIRERTSLVGDSVAVNSSLIIHNVSHGDLGNYSCVAINKGGMAESISELVLLQTTLWTDIIQELIIVIAVLGAAVACLFSLIVVKILANRKSSASQAGMTLCTRSGSGYDDVSSHQSLIRHSASICRSLGDSDRKCVSNGSMSCEAPGLEQYYSPHPDQYPDLINIQYQGHQGHSNGHHLQYSPSGAVQYSPHQHDMSPPPPPLEWDNQDHYSGGSAEIILMPPSPFSPTYNISNCGMKAQEPEIDLQTTLQRRKLAMAIKPAPAATLPKPIIKNSSSNNCNGVAENNVRFNMVSF